MIRLGIVTDCDDPKGLRRVRVTTSDRGLGQSDWVPRVTGFADEDLPVPPIGSTVVIANLEDGSVDEVVIGVLQTGRSNKPIREKTQLQDWYSVLTGLVDWFTEGWIRLRSRERVTLECGKSRVELHPDGRITLTNGISQLTLEADGQLRFDQTGSPLIRFAMVGGLDTDNDTTLS